MTKTILQIENTNPEDFKKEILTGISEIFKDHLATSKSQNQDTLLTRIETAEMLSISLVTLWKWTKDDIIPAFRIGNKVRYKRKEVIEALQQMNNFK